MDQKGKRKMTTMIISDMVRKIPVPADKKIKQKDYLLNGTLQIVDQGEGLVGGYTNDISKAISTELPVIIFGDHTRAVKYINFPFGAGADGIKVLKPKEGVLPKYLFYGLQYLVLRLEDRGYARHYQYLEKMALRTTDVKEQEHIVARIEELFSELDNGVETLKTTKEQLAVYRQAVLKEAFEGKLTCEWRKEHLQNDETDIWDEICRYKTKCGNNNKYAQDEHIELPSLPKGWKWISVGDIAHGVEYGTSKKSLKNGKVPVIRMGNIQNGSIDWSDLVYSDDEDEISKYSLTKGDVLFNRTNSPELVGKTAVYNGGRKAIFAGYLIRINQFPCIDANYLTYYLNSYTAKNYGNKVKTDGVNQSNINGKKLCSYPFPLCSKEEQQRVVYELESRLSVCDFIEKTIDSTLQQAESMRQSILKEAFKGGK